VAEHLAAVRLQRFPVQVDRAAQLIDDGRLVLDAEADHYRRHRLDPVLPVDQVAQLVHGLDARMPVGLVHVFVAPPDGLARLDRVEQLAHLIDVDPGIPRVEEPHLGEVRHLGAVHMRAPPGRRALGPGIEAVVPDGHGYARGQPLDVPLERPRQRLVEVIHVEYQPPVRCAEHAEVK
jgi:hypothetical protein